MVERQCSQLYFSLIMSSELTLGTTIGAALLGGFATTLYVPVVF
jgi:hypothetical protein